MRIKIDGEIYEVDKVYANRHPVLIQGGKMEFYAFEDSEEAGKAVAEHYRDMANDDPQEFTAIIGEQRLIGWAMNKSDSFGISSFDEFLERVAEVPEDHWASYDGQEREIQRVGKLYDELGFVPTVAYRHN